jgi:hypothetical protein
MASRRQRPGTILGLVVLLFFLPGSAALLYQISGNVCSDFFRQEDPLIGDLLAGEFERYSASPDKLATTDVNSDLFPKTSI